MYLGPINMICQTCFNSINALLRFLPTRFYKIAFTKQRPVVGEVAVGHRTEDVEELLVAEPEPIIVSVEERVEEEDLFEPAKVSSFALGSILDQSSGFFHKF